MEKTESSLVIVGSGIKFLSHLTREAEVYIRQSNFVLYLVNDPAMKLWIKKANPNAESLDQLYVKYPLRLDCYRAITEYILASLRKNQHICVVLYGHPSVFSQPGLDAVKQAKKEGYYAKILPGISAEDCLFADLCIDPATNGCQSYEATDFIIHQRQFSPTSHLILWQADVIGRLDHAENHDNTHGINILINHLKNYYEPQHEITIYEAAQYPHLEPKITHCNLESLVTIKLSSISTLYIPPLLNKK